MATMTTELKSASTMEGVGSGRSKSPASMATSAMMSSTAPRELMANPTATEAFTGIPEK